MSLASCDRSAEPHPEARSALTAQAVKCSVLGAAVFLSGCAVTPAFLPSATQPTPPENVKQAPNERLLAFQQAREGASAIAVVTRDIGPFGAACHYAVVVNGALAARLSTGEASRFYLMPGEVRMKATADPNATGLCAIGQGADGPELRVDLRANETRHFRLHLDRHGALYILPE